MLRGAGKRLFPRRLAFKLPARRERAKSGKGRLAIAGTSEAGGGFGRAAGGSGLPGHDLAEVSAGDFAVGQLDGDGHGAVGALPGHALLVERMAVDGAALRRAAA